MKKIFLGVFLSTWILSCNNEKKDEPTTAAPAATTTEAAKNADELLAMSETDGVKKSLEAFSKGDIDAMTADYDDNARQTWSGGDSLVGKKAIQDYYKGRWKIIKSLNFSDYILLPVKVNKQQSAFAPTGKWVLAWSFAHVEYKNNKKLDFWVHNVYHYNDAGKVDFIGQYLDRHPIMEATKDLMK